MDARWLGWSLLVAGGALGWAAAADGQDLSGYFPQGVPGYDTAPGVTVQSRARPQYDPVGVRAGSFLLYPQVDLGVGYDSNLFGTAPMPGKNPGSWVFNTSASLRANSVWGRDSLGGYFSVDHADDLDLPSQSRTDWTGSAGGTVNINEDQLTLGAAHLSLHQAPTAIDALPTDEPVPYQVNDLRASYVHDFDRLSLTPDLDFTTYRFGNTTIGGVPALQAYRDRDVLEAGLTARYPVAPLRTILFVLRGTGTHYTQPQPGAPSRNSTGGLALIGVERGDGVWDLRLLAGWEQRDFVAPQYRAHGAPAAEADVTWSPSGLTTVTGTLSRTIEDAAQEGVAGYTNTTARLVIDHEYLRNVLLNGFASLQHAAFLEGGGTQTLFGLGGGVTWLMNRHVRLSGTETFFDMRSIQGGSAPSSGSYLRSLTLLTLGLGL
jgi:hypothetical protein